jgi:hypothetical protein
VDRGGHRADPSLKGIWSALQLKAERDDLSAAPKVSNPRYDIWQAMQELQSISAIFPLGRVNLRTARAIKLRKCQELR